MNTQTRLQLSLEDLLADLRHARRQDDLGRLAVVAYCDVRRWARQTGERALAQHTSALFTAGPHPDRQTFLVHIDALLSELEQTHERLVRAAEECASPT